MYRFEMCNQKFQTRKVMLITHAVNHTHEIEWKPCLGYLGIRDNALGNRHRHVPEDVWVENNTPYNTCVCFFYEMYENEFPPKAQFCHGWCNYGHYYFNHRRSLNWWIHSLTQGIWCIKLRTPPTQTSHLNTKFSLFTGVRQSMQCKFSSTTFLPSYFLIVYIGLFNHAPYGLISNCDHQVQTCVCRMLQFEFFFSLYLRSALYCTYVCIFGSYHKNSILVLIIMSLSYYVVNGYLYPYLNASTFWLFIDWYSNGTNFALGLNP